MSVHFKHAATPPAGAVAKSLEQLPQVLGERRAPNLSFFGKMKLRAEERAIAYSEEVHKRQVLSQETQATDDHAVSLQGVAERTALSRVYGDVIVAELHAMGESHAAAVQAQKGALTSASLANLLSKNEDLAQITKLYQSGQISAHDAEAMARQIVDAHVDAETRLDALHQAIASTTDHVYQSGFAPVAHTIGKK